MSVERRSYSMATNDVVEGILDPSMCYNDASRFSKSVHVLQQTSNLASIVYNRRPTKHPSFTTGVQNSVHVLHVSSKIASMFYMCRPCITSAVQFRVHVLQVHVFQVHKLQRSVQGFSKFVHAFPKIVQVFPNFVQVFLNFVQVFPENRPIVQRPCFTTSP